MGDIGESVDRQEVVLLVVVRGRQIALMLKAVKTALDGGLNQNLLVVVVMQQVLFHLGQLCIREHNIVSLVLRLDSLAFKAVVQ